MKSSFLNLFLRSFLLVLASGWIFSSCRLEEEKLDPNPANGLVFSDDTIYFDTVFTSQQTATLRIKVYNQNAKAITIKSVFLSGVDGKQPFSFFINGRNGPQRVNGVELMGKDSAYVLVSAKIDARNDNFPFFVRDSLQFEIEGRNQVQKVQIVAYGQDAVYFKAQSLACNQVWTKERPIIIMDTVSVAKGCTLTVEAGTRVYAYNSAALLVRGTLLVNGTATDSVTFQGWRRESYYSRVPGQWFGIWFFDGSGVNQISFALIKNAYRALQVGEVGEINRPKAFLLIRNSRIQNVVDYGLLALQSVVVSISNQFSDCGEVGFAGYQGGGYELWHNTFGESGNNPFRRETPMVAFTDHFPPNNNWAFGAPLSAKLVNNIITGGESNELNFVSRTGGQVRFDTLLYGNIIKSKDFNYFKTSSRINNNLNFPSGARFKSPFSYNFRPDSASFSAAYQAGIALDTVKSSFIQDLLLLEFLKTDIAGAVRPVSAGIHPDAGAYQKNP